MSSSSNPELIRRATAAWFRNGNADEVLGQPSNASDVHEVNGLFYVVLRNVNGVLAVYRVLDTAERKQLKRMVRWPAELNGGADRVTTKIVSGLAKFDETVASAKKMFGKDFRLT
jgi:hypothetical protein